jgi:hypothetical protein
MATAMREKTSKHELLLGKTICPHGWGHPFFGQWTAENHLDRSRRCAPLRQKP